MFEIKLEKYQEMKSYCKKCKDCFNGGHCCGTPSTCMYAYNVEWDECEKGKEYPTLCRYNTV